MEREFLPRVQQSAEQGIPATLLVPHNPRGTLYQPGGTARLLASQAHAAACTCWGKCCSISKEKQSVLHCAPSLVPWPARVGKAEDAPGLPSPLCTCPGSGAAPRGVQAAPFCAVVTASVWVRSFLCPGTQGTWCPTGAGQNALPTAPPPRAHTAWPSGARHRALALYLQAA